MHLQYWHSTTWSIVIKLSNNHQLAIQFVPLTKLAKQVIWLVSLTRPFWSDDFLLEKANEGNRRALLNAEPSCYVASWDGDERASWGKRRRCARYSTRSATVSTGTVHVVVAVARAGGAGGGRPRGFAHGRQERRDFLLISCLIRLIHLLSLYREVWLGP